MLTKAELVEALQDPSWQPEEVHIHTRCHASANCLDNWRLYEMRATANWGGVNAEVPPVVFQAWTSQHTQHVSSLTSSLRSLVTTVLRAELDGQLRDILQAEAAEERAREEDGDCSDIPDY